MRLRGRWLALLLLGGALYFSGAAEWAWYTGGEFVRGLVRRQEGPPSWRFAKIKDSMISMSYVLDGERWLEFELPPEQKVIRVMSNADLPEARRAEMRTPLPDDLAWTYALRYQLVDTWGKVLFERDYYHRTRLTEWDDEETKSAITSTFYLGQPVLPVDGRSIQINLADCPAPPARLRVRLLRADDPLTGAVVRVYYLDEQTPYKLPYLWQRMYQDRRDKLARGNIYSSDLLTEKEKRNLLQTRLTALAPVGIEGRDYHERDIYVLKEIDQDPVKDPPPPAGLLLDSDRRAVIPLPEEGGVVRLVFEPLLPKDAARQNEAIQVLWYGKGLSQRANYSIPWNGRHTTWERAFEPGVLEVQTHFPMAVRAFAPHGRRPDRKHLPGDTELTPDLLYVWTYLLQGPAPVEFDVRREAGEATPLRVDLRQYLPVAWQWTIGDTVQPIKPVAVAYQFLDRQGRIVREGRLPVSTPLSVYDRLKKDRFDFPITEPASFFFSVPAEVVRVRFPPTDLPIFVTCYNRPGHLPKASRVPEDYFRYNRNDVVQRSWFLFQARQHYALEVADRVPTLMLQSRPQVDDPDLLAGHYQWEDYPANGSWRARHLFTPRDPDAVFRPEALLVTYREVVPGKDTVLEFQAQPGRTEIPLTLVYFASKSGPIAFTFTVDGRPLYETTVAGTRGEVLLPPLTSKAKREKHTIRITASRKARLFVNYLDPGKEPAFVKRLGIALGPEEVVFDYEKVSKNEELLSLTLFRPAGQTERSTVEARIESAAGAALGPFTSWTFRDRVYDLRPGEGDPVPVLGTDDENVDAGQQFFFPLGNDLPPGKYRVRLRLTKGPAGYVIITRSVAGPSEKLEFFEEQPYRFGKPGGK